MTKIVLSRVEINANTISVSSDESSTTYFNEPFIAKVDLKDLTKRINALIKNARAKKISVSQKHKTKDLVKELTESYEAAYAKYNELYEQLKAGVQAKVDKGIFAPTSDDVELKGLYDIRNAMMAMNYRSEPISRINEVAYRISEFERSVGQESCSKIFL